MRSICSYLSLAILSFWTAGVRGEDSSTPLDNEFLIKAAPMQQAEITISKLADKHSDSAKVKDFAAQVVKDHQQCYDKLAATLKNRKIAIVSGFEKPIQDEIDRLKKLHGADFDREYLSFMIKAHQKAINCFETQVKNGKDGEIREFAQGALPTLRKHLEEAEALAKGAN